MEKMNRETLKTAARVLAAGFMEDPLNIAILEGLTDKRKLMTAHATISVKHALKTKSLYLLENNPQAVLIGIDSKEENKFRDLQQILNVYLTTFIILSFKDLKRIAGNYRKVSKILSFTWHKEFVKNRYYRLKVIAIDKSLRGSGAFRKLISPMIEYADREGIAMVLETHNHDNVGLYEHFGFELVKTISSAETEIRQYCMIRNPIRISEVEGDTNE